jgi:hypothetical protein
MVYKKFINSQLYYVNSRNRINGTDSNFSFKIDIDQTINYDRVAIVDASIPKSYYLIQDGRNTFTLQEGINTITITLTPGNYSRLSLKTSLQTKLNESSTFDYIVSYSSSPSYDDGKFIFTVSNNSGTQPQFIFSDYLYEQLGFNRNSTNTFTANVLSSTNVINLQPETTLMIRSDICQNRNENILQNISSSGNSDFSYIVYQNFNLDIYSKTMNSNTSNTYNFILTDEDGNEINLNGLNMIFTLLVYKSDDFNEKVLDYIKYKTIQNINNENIF